MKIGEFYEYNGYKGMIKYSLEDKQYYGELLNIKDLINYGADTIDELYEQFKNAVDNYIDFKKYIIELQGDNR